MASLGGRETLELRALGWAAGLGSAGFGVFDGVDQ